MSPPIQVTVPLQESPNTRDLGGYVTAYGMRTRFGLLYRSGELAKLTDDDVVVLNGLGLRTVLDFRLPDEVRTAGPDRLPDGLTPVALPIGGGGVDGIYALARSGDRDLMRQALGDGRAERSMEKIYRGFVSDDADRAAFAEALRKIVDAEATPLLFHCTAGKDRTGWLAAIVLRILGVTRHEYLDDFLLSNTHFGRVAERQLYAMGLSEGEAWMFRPLLSQQPAYLLAAFAEADTVYGSFEAFVHKGLNVEPAEADALRSRLLEPVPA